MAPIVKDVENSAAIPAPATPANKAPQDASATRPQPVALEIPVTVNGARTLEGSDKREPFSESTQTVLVFAHGAVIRLASLVSPGQLLFVTNEKTKKEVVCQVVKSKNYRTVTGYVELEFTEPAAGFWGMRFPAERVAPIPAPAGVPAAPSSTPRPVAPVSTLTPVPAKVVAPPAAPVAEKPAMPTPLPTRPISIAAPVAPPTVAKPPASKPDLPMESLSAPQIAQQQTSVPAAPVISAQTVVPAPPVSKSEPIPVPELHAGSLAPTVSSSAGSNTKSATPQATKSEPTMQAANPTTEDLKQQAARLQEQLKSLLFTQAPTAKASSPEPPVSPKPEIIPTETVQKIIQLAPPDVKPLAPVSTPVQESKPAPLTLKSVPLSMEVEEVKVPTWLKPSMRETEPRPPEPVNIPAWLAPLTRDPEPSRAQGANEAAILGAPEAISSASPVETDSLLPDGEHGSTAQPTMFGGQLLGSSLADGEASTSDSSKKRLFIGMAAAGMLLIAGGAWYAKQPGSVLSGLFAAKPAAPQTSQNLPAPVSQPAFRTDAAAPPSSAVTPLNQLPPSKTITPLPAASSAVNSAPVPAVVKETTSAPRNEPAVELPKKTVFGRVHLATPNVNRPGTTSENGEAPSIDAGQTSAAEPLEDLGGSRSKAPKAPLPIGGDVIPAKLLKSVPPIYPPTARSQRIAGDVKIDALVDASGNVSTMKVITGPPLLHQAAMMALKQWKYEPAKLDGNATAMHLTVTVQFRLQ